MTEMSTKVTCSDIDDLGSCKLPAIAGCPGPHGEMYALRSCATAAENREAPVPLESEVIGPRYSDTQ